MSYEVIWRPIAFNHNGALLVPQGWVIHSTANQGATDEGHFIYFNSAYRGASAHYFADWDSISQFIKESERAWHAGPTANSKFLSVEFCEPKDTDPDRFRKFEETWNRVVWLVADRCVKYGWSTDRIYSHNDISLMWRETTHTDPVGFFKKYAKTMDMFKQAVQAKINQIKGVDVVNNLVVFFGPGDEPAAKLLADYKKCPVVSMENYTDELTIGVKNIFVVGGQWKPADKAILLSGIDRNDTADLIIEFIKARK